MNSGFLLINKPSGPTSHDVIDDLRRVTGIRKIGHAGTLDPFATGLLIVGIGRESTKRLDEFLKLDKEYIATLKLGAVSDTYDRTGNILVPELVEGPSTSLRSAQAMTREQIEQVLNKFRGEIEQVPPMYSAKKVKGKKLYELARMGEEIERKSVKVKIYELGITSYKSPILVLKMCVSSGTYVRSLAHDIGTELGIGAYLEELERISIGEYKLDDAIKLKELNSGNWQELLKY